MPVAEVDRLQSEIDERRRMIRSTSYSISIGELISLYDDEEIDIHPQFQRQFRWSTLQKSMLIESFLLGIPVPPVFVAQREDGVLDVVDGHQRLSTILEFAGKLKDEDGKQKAPLVLEETDYLPSLAGRLWEDDENPARSISRDQRLMIKRAKLDMVIMERESDENAKFDLFMRLNTGGTALSAQEVRNCLLVMLRPELLEDLEKLAACEAFKECVPLTERQEEERYDLELVLRFLLFREATTDQLKEISDVGKFITDEMRQLAENRGNRMEQGEAAFRATFDFLQGTLGDNSFRRWAPEDRRFKGAVSVAAYETIACGIGHHCTAEGYLGLPQKTEEQVKAIWSGQTRFREFARSGVRGSSRLPQLIPLGRELFTP